MREITSHFAAYGKAVIAGRKADGGPAGLIDHMDVWTLPAAWRRLRAGIVGSHRSPERTLGVARTIALLLFRAVRVRITAVRADALRPAEGAKPGDFVACQLK
jgi:hypothetical protein